jgi:hypothetical protein
MNSTRVLIHYVAFLTDVVLLILFILRAKSTVDLATHLALDILGHRFSEAQLIIGGHPFHHHVFIVFHRVSHCCSRVMRSLLWCVFDPTASA